MAALTIGGWVPVSVPPLRWAAALMVGAIAVGVAPHLADSIATSDRAPVVTDDTWPAGLREAFAADALAVRPDGVGRLRASTANPSVDAVFATDGMTVGGDGWRFGLTLTSVGGTAVATAAPVGTGTDVAYERGPVTEWYRNATTGLEQGFTIAEPIPGDELVVEMTVTGGLDLDVLRGGQALAATLPQGGRLTYDHLLVVDAAGLVLPSRMALADDGRALRLVTDIADATWPVTVDPIINAEQAHLLADDAAPGDLLGTSIALSGDTAVVGAPNDFGAAYVYVRDGTTWTQQAHLVASDGATADLFGLSVALAGDTAVVSSPFDDTELGGTDAGSAYVFVRSGVTWTEQAHLVASDGAAGDRFGNSVALSRNTAVIGAVGDDTTAGGVDAGSAYVYTRSGSTWTPSTHLFADDGVSSDQFGYAVAVSGNTALVSAPFDNTAFLDAGSAYVFVRAGGTWVQQAHVLASDGLVFDQFGSSVAIVGDTAVIGADADDTAAGGTDAGSAYVFVRSGTTWAEQAHLFASDGTGSDTFGDAVAVSGDTAVVGAFLDDTALGGTDAGSAYVFVRSGTTWAEQAHLFASDAAPTDWFSKSVAVWGDTAVIGASSDVTDAGNNAGSVYVFVPGAFAVTDTILSEGNAGTTDATFTVTLPVAYPVTTSVEVHTVDGTASAGSDYVAVNTTVTFDPGQTAQTVTVPVIGDTVVEADEVFYVSLSNSVGAPIGDDTGQATVVNDDVTVSINDKAVTEGDAGTRNLRFTISRSGVSESTVKVTVTTSDGTATAGSDYTALSKLIKFGPGVTTKTVNVVIAGDTAVEPDETLVATLSNPVGVTIDDGTGTGTITNDDP